MTAQWFGASTILIREGEHGILIDGFLSRPGILDTLFTAIGPDARTSEAVLRRSGAGTFQAILVAHAHHDHVLDAPVLVHDRTAVLYGSNSVGNVAAAHGVTRESGKFRHLTAGPLPGLAGFNVQVYQTKHAKSFFRLGDISAPFKQRAHALAYSSGPNFNFLLERRGQRVLIVPSPDVPAGTFGNERADVVFLGIGMLGKRSASFICKLWEEAVHQRHARQVILVHWDNFVYPLDGPLRTFGWFLDDVPHSVEMLEKLAKDDDIDLRFAPAYRPVGLSFAAEPPNAEKPAPRPRRDCDHWNGNNQ
jgi:L-ascorbate metabolism protein UlaG (beta-lactamase superfamily)